MDVVAEIKARTNPVALVGDYVRLERRGAEYVGLCPFHTEKTPSFTLNPQKGLWYCFGCGEGGDVISFYQKVEGLDFKAALRELGKRVGVEVETDANPRRKQEEEVLLTAWDAMKKRRRARAEAFLRDRNLPLDMEIGFDVGDWVKRVDPTIAESLSLVTNLNGGLVSTLRWRYVLPIYWRGSLVGFTGRASAPNQKPKWRYSRFPRKRVVYGLDAAEGKARKSGYVIVVEGPIDAIRLMAMGHPAVAILGSSMSNEQAISLVRLGVEIWLGLDADNAGEKGTLRAIELLRGRAPIKVVSWAPYKDPGEIPDSFSVEAVDAGTYLWKLTAGSPIEVRQRKLAKWLEPVSNGDTIPTTLRRHLEQAGAVLPSQGPAPKVEKPSRAAERLLEADIAAVLFSVVDRDERARLASELKLNIYPDVGEMLAKLLDVVDQDDPLAALREIGAGATFVRRIMEAPPYTYDEARKKLLSLARQLSIKQLRVAMADATERGDLEAAYEANLTLEALRRGRYD